MPPRKPPLRLEGAEAVALVYLAGFGAFLEGSCSYLHTREPRGHFADSRRRAPQSQQIREDRWIGDPANAVNACREMLQIRSQWAWEPSANDGAILPLTVSQENVYSLHWSGGPPRRSAKSFRAFPGPLFCPVLGHASRYVSPLC